MAATAPNPGPGALDRTALVLALCVWGGHFLVLSTTFHFIPERPGSLAILAARAIVCAAGVLFCLGTYALLRRQRQGLSALFLKAAALSVVSAAALVAVGRIAFLMLTTYYSQNPQELFDFYLAGWLLIFYLWTQLTWCALFTGAVAIGAMRRRDAQLAAMRESARQAQLRALRLQINPHFLFNTLNTLAGFIVLGRKDESERIVLNLSRFFRHTLTHTSAHLVPLIAEIDMLRMYLEIETARFRDRLRVRYDIPPECERALVPGLILLPLAENSIRHALAHAEPGIRIDIGARREDESLLLWLQDDGAAAEVAGESGRDLSSTRQQLAALYGDAAMLDSGPRTYGWRSQIRVPWREATP